MDVGGRDGCVFGRIRPIAFALLGYKEHKIDAFPASGAISGWEKTGNTRTFAAKDL
ncbi:MAG: hypothetical protein ABSB50_17610 [Terracidiphilus sp.]|jgi:hypothetical protein